MYKRQTSCSVNANALCISILSCSSIPPSCSASSTKVKMCIRDSWLKRRRALLPPLSRNRHYKRPIPNETAPSLSLIHISISQVAFPGKPLRPPRCATEILPAHPWQLWTPPALLPTLLTEKWFPMSFEKDVYKRQPVPSLSSYISIT